MAGALGNGVIGNTAVSGTVIQGSSPCSPTITTVSRGLPRGSRFCIWVSDRHVLDICSMAELAPSFRVPENRHHTSRARVSLLLVVALIAVVASPVGKPHLASVRAAITDGETSKFKIESLTASTTNRTAIEVASFTGDDRGGIGLSATKVALRGDSSLGVFNKSDFSSPVATPSNSAFDAIVSDLKTMTMYAFDFSGSSGTFTKLFQLDQTTGAVPASPTVITLSSSIPYSNGELYSGYGRVVYRHGNGTVYDVDLPSGTVYNRGTVTVSAMGTENSIRGWGIAEFFDGDLWLAISSGAAINRYKVGTSTQQTILSTNGMSDLASFIVDPISQRWYFHYEGYAQAFNFGSDETLGFAPAVITTTPSITFTPSSNATNQSSLSVGVTFSEAVTGVAASDFSLHGTSTGWSISSLVANSATSYTLNLTQASQVDGTLSVRLAANSVSWTAGSTTIPDSNTNSDSITVDYTAPTATIASAPSSPASGMTQTFGVTFSESVSGISSADFSNTGTAQGCVFTPSATSGTSINVVVTQCQEGTLQFRIAQNAVTDVASNTGPASPVQSSVITLQASALTITAGAKSINYGGSWVDSYTQSGLIGGDSISSVIYSYSGTTTLGSTYGPSTTKPTMGGSYTITPTVVLNVGNTNRYAVSYVSAPLTISRIAQSALSITTTSATFGVVLTLGTSGGSGSGAVTYSVNSGTCIVSSNLLTLGDAGSSCSLTATKAADDNYTAVSSVSTSISTAKATQASLSLTTTTATYGQGLPLGVTGGSGTGAVSYSVVSGTCTIVGALLTPGNAGSSCVIKATKATDTNYLERSSSNTTITVNKASQTGLNITSASNFTTGNSLTLTATGGQSTGSLSWSVNSGICSLTGTTLTAARGGVSCVVEVTRAGDSNYLSSSSTETIVVDKIVQVLTFRSTPPSSAVVGGTYTVSVDSDASLAPTVSIANSSSSVCSISAGVVTFSAVGTCVISASQAGNDQIAAAAASQSITVGSVPTTTVAPVANNVGAAPVVTSTIPQRAVAAPASTSSTTSTTTTTTTTIPADPGVPNLGSNGEVLELEVGELTATVRGQKVNVVTETRDGQITMTLPGKVVLKIGTTDTASGGVQVSDDGVLRTYGNSQLGVSAEGFIPGTTYTVFMFSDPVELGRGEASADGTMTRTVVIPEDAETGEHTLQINGVGNGSEVVSVSMGFEVIERDDNTRVAVIVILLAVALALLGGRPIFRRRRRA